MVGMLLAFTFCSLLFLLTGIAIGYYISFENRKLPAEVKKVFLKKRGVKAGLVKPLSQEERNKSQLQKETEEVMSKTFMDILNGKM
jgi:hypothetical protein